MEDQQILAYDGARALTYSDLLEDVAALKEEYPDKDELFYEIRYLLTKVYKVAYDVNEFI